MVIPKSLLCKSSNLSVSIDGMPIHVKSHTKIAFFHIHYNYSIFRTLQLRVLTLTKHSAHITTATELFISYSAFHSLESPCSNVLAIQRSRLSTLGRQVLQCFSPTHKRMTGHTFSFIILI